MGADADDACLRRSLFEEGADAVDECAVADRDVDDVDRVRMLEQFHCDRPGAFGDLVFQPVLDIGVAASRREIEGDRFRLNAPPGEHAPTCCFPLCSQPLF